MTLVIAAWYAATTVIDARRDKGGDGVVDADFASEFAIAQNSRTTTANAQNKNNGTVGVARQQAAVSGDSLRSADYVDVAPHSSLGDSTSSASLIDQNNVPEGAQFPISESIKEKCASYGNNSAIDCSDVWLALNRIETEKVDYQWARRMEGKILEAVSAVPGHRVRALACRSTTCAVETESERGIFLEWRSLRNDLLTGDRIFGYERRSGGLTTVTLSTFERR